MNTFLFYLYYWDKEKTNTSEEALCKQHQKYIFIKVNFLDVVNIFSLRL